MSPARPAAITRPSDFPGLLDALAAAGLPERAVIRHGGRLGFNDGLRAGVEAAQSYLAMKRRPTATVCCADDGAISFIGTVRPHGVAVPGDVSVLGFDGAAVGAFCDPSLTTLAQADPGSRPRAAEIMLQLLEDATAAPPPKTTLSSQLLLRASTDAPRSTPGKVHLSPGATAGRPIQSAASARSGAL